MKQGDEVRLLEDWVGVTAGTVGYVVGFYRRAIAEEVAVDFPGASLVLPDGVLELVPAEASAEERQGTDPEH